MPDGIRGEAHVRAFKPEQKKSDNCDGENNGICHEQVFTRFVAVDADDELDDGEQDYNEGEHDHRRHQQQAKEVCNAGKN